ncbi:MAG: tRNA glutamyl-Q(34) synthetase GluQRS, partial [Rhodobacteraceae bacterium]|nr:tRNA glutamyl-Q(34) synthetase GluQRS [Paracoccaceae bacterium]
MNAAPQTVTRFAPSPTGLLHLGTVRAALIAAREAGSGTFLLRIENIDTGRCRAEFEAAIYEDLEWLGLKWPAPVRRQAEHFADYAKAIETLKDAGVLYPCFCTRADIQREIVNASGAPHLFRDGPDGPIYPGICRNLDPDEATRRMASGEPYALRLHMARAKDRASDHIGTLTWHDRLQGQQRATPEIFGDVVIARKDTPASYHLASVWDDALQGVTLVTRGEELFAATHVHRLLQALLKLPTPDYYHHALYLNGDGQKVSKRDAGLTVRHLRESGHTPAAVIAM